MVTFEKSQIFNTCDVGRLVLQLHVTENINKTLVRNFSLYGNNRKHSLTLFGFLPVGK